MCWCVSSGICSKDCARKSHCSECSSPRKTAPPRAIYRNTRCLYNSAPKLKTLGHLTDKISRLQFGTNIFKTFSITMDDQFCDDDVDHIECLNCHLKTLVLGYYRGYKSHVDLVKFFLLKAKVLESMKLDVRSRKNVKSKKWLEKQREWLQVPSIGSCIDFTDIDYVSLDDIHESSDPFERRCCNERN
ncbi:hypothetical protein EJB05_13094, partial [Eragrostis curvula]